MNRIKNVKNQQGFTLVEVIVVAIIVAALAAVAIPLYNGYVTSSRNNAAANAAGSVASFMGACINQGGKAAGVTASTYAPGPVKITCTGTAVDSTQIPSIAIPKGVSISISSLSASGQVIGLGGLVSDGFTEQKYNY